MSSLNLLSDTFFYFYRRILASTNWYSPTMTHTKNCIRILLLPSSRQETSSSFDNPCSQSARPSFHWKAMYLGAILGSALGYGHLVLDWRYVSKDLLYNNQWREVCVQFEPSWGLYCLLLLPVPFLRLRICRLIDNLECTRIIKFEDLTNKSYSWLCSSLQIYITC
jgi:hypothetical protein